MESKRVKAFLIEDSGFMRIYIADILRSDKSIQVIGTASNGKEGVEKVKMLKPDVVITDMIMPEYDGLYVVKTLMRQMPLPIILLSSLDRSNQQVFDALNAGAFHFVDKPKKEDANHSGEELATLVKEAAGITVGPSALVHKRNSSIHSFDSGLFDVIAIGASTGGPSAIEYIVNNLPGNLTIPVLIAQHMPDHFIHSFAQRLNNLTALEVKVAQEGELVKDGVIHLMPGTVNMKIGRNAKTGMVVFESTEHHYKEYNAPSVDCLFDSVANVYEKRAIGVLLTGMGKDGAEGLLSMKNRNAFTIAQNEESSVVFGMPQAAANLGAVCEVLPLKEIPGFIISFL